MFVTGRRRITFLTVSTTFIAMSAVACRSRSFNSANNTDADADANGDGLPDAAPPVRWFQCVEAGKSTTWRLDVPSPSAPSPSPGDPDSASESRLGEGDPQAEEGLPPLVILRDGRTVFRAEAKEQIDRAEPSARLLQAYGLVGVRSYRRIEIPTTRGNVTVDWARGSDTGLARTLFLTLRVQGDGFQALVRCDLRKRAHFEGARLPGLSASSHIKHGVTAMARATSEWRSLDGASQTADDGTRTHATCDTGEGRQAAWRLEEKNGRLKVTRGSSKPQVDAPIVSLDSTRADEDIRGSRYVTWSRAWKLEGDAEISVKEYAQIFEEADEDLARGARWTLPGEPSELICQGEPELRPPAP
jgi:hypothetical protein